MIAPTPLETPTPGLAGREILGCVAGGTPLIDLFVRLRGRNLRIGLKLEGHNPHGSSKDRTAAAMLEDLRRRGTLQRRKVVVESSSGNLAVALAARCRELGVGFLAVIDPRTTAEAVARLHHHSAQVMMVDEPDPTGGYLLTRLATVRRILAEREDCVWTNQYANPANPRAHYHGTAPEIVAQTDGRVDAVFVAVSTGGTMAGVGAYLARHQRGARRVAVDVEGSAALGVGPARPRHLPGLGSARRSRFLSAACYDEASIVPESDALGVCWRVHRDTGLMLGASAGAVVAASLRYLLDHPRIRRPVCVCADSGESYRSTIYDPAWAERVGIVPRDPLAARESFSLGV
jgi:cysteine synthase A